MSVGVAGQHLEVRYTFCIHLVEEALVGVDQWHQFREEHLADGGQIALALQHTGETGQVRLEPVLFVVAFGGKPQVVDHSVDVVFQLGNLAAGLDLDGQRVKSPLVTAVATSAIARTWLVRLSASRFTLPVRSFHVPAAPGTLA